MPGDQTYGVVVVTATNPSRSRIGRPSIACSICAIRRRSTGPETSRTTTPSGRLVGRDCGDGSDHDGLQVFGHKPGCAQALWEIGRAIVPVQLPLEGLAALGEDPHLPRDQLVELASVEAVEIPILDHPAVPEAHRAQQRAVALDTNRAGKRVMHVGAQLRVIRAEEGDEVHCAS